MAKKDKKQQELLNYIKTNALMGNSEHIENALNDFFFVIKLPKEVLSMSPDEYNEAVWQHSQKNQKFAETLEIINLGQELINLKTSNELNNLTIKDFEIKIRDFERNQKISADAAAYAYYNLGMLYQAQQSKGALTDNRELTATAKNSFRRALKLTSDIRLIELITEELDTNITNPEIVREAYHRALNNPENPDLFNTYYGCAKTYLQSPSSSKVSIQRMSDKSVNNDEMALFYFEEALEHTDNDQDRQKVLRHIQSIQKRNKSKDFFSTSMQISNLMKGLMKSKYLYDLSQQKDVLTDSQQKQVLLEAAKAISLPDRSPKGYKKQLWQRINNDIKIFSKSFTPEEAKELSKITKSFNKIIASNSNASKTKDR